jgi:GGDEF domain-containing protein
MSAQPVLLYRPFWFGAWGATLPVVLGGVFAQPVLWLETALFLGLQLLVTWLCWRFLPSFAENATAAQMILGLVLSVLFVVYTLPTWRDLGLEPLIYSVAVSPYAMGLVLAWGWAGLVLCGAVGVMLWLLPYGSSPLFVGGFLVFLVFLSFGWLMHRTMQRLKYRLLELERSVNTDALTQIGNRKALLEDFIAFKAVAQKKALPLLLTSWDVDGLKRINDREGHQVGDEYIKGFVNALRGAVREGDGLYRTGGDEFVGLHLGLASGQKLYERVRGTFPNVSGGWSRATGQTLDQALTEADVQMYAEKRAHKAVITSIIGESQTR